MTNGTAGARKERRNGTIKAGTYGICPEVLKVMHLLNPDERELLRCMKLHGSDIRVPKDVKPNGSSVLPVGSFDWARVRPPGIVDSALKNMGKELGNGVPGIPIKLFMQEVLIIA